VGDGQGSGSPIIPDSGQQATEGEGVIDPLNFSESNHRNPSCPRQSCCQFLGQWGIGPHFSVSTNFVVGRLVATLPLGKKSAESVRMWQKSTMNDWLTSVTHAAIVVGVAVTVQTIFLASILVVLSVGDWGTAIAKLLSGNQ